MAENIGNVFIEQSFAMLLIFCAALFDLIIIATFIVSLFYDLGAFDIIGEIINVTIAPLVLGGILLAMGGSKYALKKTEQIAAPTDENQPPKIKQQKEAAQVEKSDTKKETPAVSEITTTEKTKEAALKQNNPATTRSNAAPGAAPKTKELPMSATGNENSGKATAKATAKQVGQEALKGGLETAGELAAGDIKGAVKTTAKTGFKISLIVIMGLLTMLLKAIPYSEAIPWYTIWAFWVWFKITSAEIKSITS